MAGTCFARLVHKPKERFDGVVSLEKVEMQLIGVFFLIKHPIRCS